MRAHDRIFISFVALFLFSATFAFGQTPETRAYEAAVRAFEDGVFDLAEKDFAAFIQTYATSPRIAEAILYRARAALRQQQTKAATDLLTTNSAYAGPLADQFQYWLAEAHRQSTNYQAAAEGFAKLVRDFPNSPRLLEASYGEALARFKLQEWARVVELLRNTNTAFYQQAQRRTNDELVIRGQLLLAEALVETGKATEAEATLRSLANRELMPEFRWRAEYLRARTQFADRRATDALASSTNLVALAAATGQRQLTAESHALRGAILERLGDYPAAIAAYENNVTESAPPEYRRQALLRIIELTLDENRIGEAAQKLQTFFSQYPQDAASEVALLTLGELHLKRHLATNAVPTPTNFLQLAMGHFDRLITNYPNGSLVGKAHLNRGWCLWLDAKIPEAQAAFIAATNKLSRSDDEAIAQFKIADTQFQLRDFTNAIASYRAVVTNYQGFPRVEDELADHALYQMLRAALEINDLPAASQAVQQILQDSEGGGADAAARRSTPFGRPFADRGLLLLGQSLTHADRAPEARALFERFLSRYPGSALRAEVELAIARSYVQEYNWEPALQKYETWMERFATNEVRPRAHYNYAYINYQAGRLTNALSLFTNFLARFPTDSNAPAAKYWVGSFYYDHKQFVEAEYHFQGLFQNTNWTVTPLTYEARMMAARAAAARQDFKSAHDYLLQLVNLASDTNCPPNLTAEAFFALGDVIVQEPADTAKPFDKFVEAITAFNKIIQLFPGNPRAPLAWGRIGDCYRQLAGQDPKFYETATNAYHQVLGSRADIAARSQAEVALGQIMEQLARTLDPALRTNAFNHYYNVVSGKNLRDDEKIDPYWYYAAGAGAVRIAEEQQQWEIAVRIYERLSEVLPPLRPALEKKIDKAREQLRGNSE
jgi:TolA-binding protein